MPNVTPGCALIQAAAKLLRTGGIDAVSARTVAAAAGVEPPALYHQFGNLNGLLDAVAGLVFDEYLRQKQGIITASADPLRVLEMLWDLHIDFGLTHPYCYMLGYVHPDQSRASARGAKTRHLLLQVLAQLDAQGRLCVGVERAANLVYSAGLGAVVTLIPIRPDERDLRISHIARETALSAIIQVEGRLPAIDPGRCFTENNWQSTRETGTGKG